MSEFIPTLGNLIEECNAIIRTIPLHLRGDYKKLFTGTEIEALLCHRVAHKSDCAIHNEPAFPKGRCNCGLLLTPTEVEEIIDREYDAEPWECAKAAVEEAIQKQLDRCSERISSEHLNN